MTNTPLVSVLMTTFNREKYVREAIESVLNSEYTHFELIIVDDHSTDNTPLVAKMYEKKDKRVKVYINDSHLGDYPNRNKAASYANGKYIKYVDSDDYIYPAGLKLLVQAMEEFPTADLGICSLPQNTYIRHPYPYQLSPKEAYEFHYFGPGLFGNSPLSAIIRREAFCKAGGFLPYRMTGDFDLWHHLSQKCNVVLIQDGVVWTREHNNREMNDFRKYFMTYEKIKIHYLFHEDCPLTPGQVNRILKVRKRKLFNITVYYFLKLNMRFSLGFLQLLIFNFINLKKQTKGRFTLPSIKII